MIRAREETVGTETPRSGNLAVCGINHRSAVLSERESFHIGRSDLIPSVKLLRMIPGVREAALVVTCNRLEAYMVLDDGIDPFGTMCEFYRRRKGIETAGKRGLFYVRHASTVARHLFRVVAGLDSLVLGEYQIQNQVKEAYSASCSAKGAGKMLHKLFHSAFRAGKAVRSKTVIGGGQYSVAGVALRLLKERLERSDPVLIVGVNESTRIVADGLSAAGFEKLLFANRTLPKAERMAARFGGESFGLNDLPDLLARCRGLVTSTGAPGFVINSRAIERCRADHDNVPALIVDMAVPRDVELPGGFDDALQLFDMEDLKTYLEQQENGRKAELPIAEGLVEDVVTSFQIWMDNRFNPGVAVLAREYERVRRKCLDEAKGHFLPENREELERFSRQLMQKFLKVPAGAVLKNADPGELTGCRVKRAAATLRRCSEGKSPSCKKEGRTPQEPKNA